MGLLDYLQTPGGQGLLSGIASYAANARRGTPINNMGRGMVGGLLGYANAGNQLRQQDEDAFQRQYRQMQMEQMQGQMQDAHRQREAAAKRQELFTQLAPQFSQPTYGQYEADNPFGENLGNLAAKTGERFDLQGFRDALPGEMAKAGFVDDALSMLPKPATPMKVSAGDRLVDPATGQEVYAAPQDETPKFGQDMLDFLHANGIDPSTASSEELSAAYNTVQSIKNNRARLGAQTVTLGSPQMFTTEDGQAVFVQPANRPGAAPQVTYLDPRLKPSTADKPPTDAEASSAGYLNRMREAEALIGGLVGGEPTEGTSVAASVPLVGKYMERKVMTPVQQQYKQAADDWIRAKLRKESGAVIGQEEMAEEYRTYFPQPGDTKEVIAQKARSRKIAERQFEISAGRALSRIGDAMPPAETPSQRPKASALPKFGEVRNGYRYVGGKNSNPNDPKNWRPVR